MWGCETRIQMDGNLTCAEAATAGFKGAGHLEDAVTAAPDPEPVSDDLACSDDDPSAPAPPACRAADPLRMAMTLEWVLTAERDRGRTGA